MESMDELMDFLDTLYGDMVKRYDNMLADVHLVFFFFFLDVDSISSYTSSSLGCYQLSSSMVCLRKG